MKTITQKSIILLLTVGFFVVASTNTTFAEDEWIDQVDNSSDYTNDGSFIDQSPTNYTYNQNSYTNPNIDYVSAGCAGCGVTDSTSWIDQSPTNYTYNQNSYTNPNIDYVNSECFGCGTNYVTPTYSEPTYTQPTYTTPSYNYTPTYSYPSYTSPSYSYTPTYTTPSYTYPTYNTIPTTPTNICSNGSYPVNGSCTVTNTIPTTTTTLCSNGTTPVNGSCSTTTTIPTTTNTICSNGSSPVNGVCVITNTIPTTVTTLCSNGQTPINGSCSITNTIPTTVTTICSDGLARNYDGTCTRGTVTPATQICSDGSRILTTQTCPSQYKVCPNGSYVLNTQSCFVPVTPVYVAPTIVKFNNVVTSVATQITNTSGRCNGIGLIANGAQSTGSFEYGETANLGRTTGTASIGNAVTAPFSNVLANLKPNTKYYCRAVMQNQYGVVKGEIVSFVTKSKVTTYVAPRAVPTKTVITKKPVVKVNTITCSDGSTISSKNATSAALINQGNKLVSLEIQKAEGKLMAGNTVTYKVVYKNLTETKLSDVVVKIVVPEEVKQVMATTGNFDENTRTLTLTQNNMDAFSEGVITISGTLAENSPVGKTIVATSYVVYTVPGTQSQDEVTAYVVGSILPVDSTTKLDTGAKKVVGAGSDRGFMPSTLVEWLALIAIIAIIFILARSIYISYQDNDGDAHGH